ncbi:MAG: DUF1292 domain-containing protein [Eubacterium sp.]|nr:DUF1292 domain-containing protein [Eubacterium sp.]MBQ9023079.1 DUF1292 domain-containing protein [Eubacterium sp.]
MAEYKNQIPQDPDIEDPDDIAVTLELEDGTVLECGILSIFTVNGQDYIALLPFDEKDQLAADTPAMLYRYYEDDEENGSIEYIESDEEYQTVEQFFFSELDKEGL